MRRAAPVEERFWAKVDKSGECWVWTGATPLGYGAFWRGGKPRMMRANRFALELALGHPVPVGMPPTSATTVRAFASIRPTSTWQRPKKTPATSMSMDGIAEERSPVRFGIALRRNGTPTRS